MSNDSFKIQKRMENMKKFYIKLNEIIDSLPDVVPEKVKILLKDKIMGDKDLKKLMDSLDEHRPPKIFLIGRTGVGKSSLINAICGSYIADVSDVKSCTKTANSYKYKSGDKVLMEILDTRGIAESESLNENIAAEDMLIEQVNEFSPDVAVFVLGCTHRDGIKDDVEFLKKLSQKYYEINHIKLPIVVVINKCDEMAPARAKEPESYPNKKIEKIQEVLQNCKNIILNNNLEIEDIVAVSSLIDWQTADGVEIAAEDISNLSKFEIENLEIAFDGRYNIEKLQDVLEKAIKDISAQMGFRMVCRLQDVIKKFAVHLNNVFSGISATVALTPIPMSDVYILLIIQCILVCLIAALSGRDISIDTAKEFIFSAGSVAGVGFAFRLAAQQASKLLNAIIPVSGSAVSSTIAFSGTFAIGNAAIAHYIEGKDIDFIRNKLKEFRNNGSKNSN